ncbi:hypothetical protein AKO1_014925 [Acrasis kona]|uniref:Uncharacterized protein n=1 Tax=Acrasis kona TaxID=1008807 RepID=A0AAW2Z139_9EUKA
MSDISQSHFRVLDYWGLQKPKTSLNPDLYKRKYWFRTLLTFRGTVIPKIFLRVMLITFLTLILNLLEHFKVWSAPELKISVHSLMGVAMGLVLVYRTNSSYDRFHDGRRQWGAIVNNCRNLLRFIATVERDVPSKQLSNLVASYCYALKNRLRGIFVIDEYSILLNNDAQREYVSSTNNKPLTISCLMSEWIWTNCDMIRENVYMYRCAEQYIGNLIDSQGGLERIVLTPIPYSYLVQIHQILAAYLLTLPFCLQDFGWYSLPAVFLISFSLLGVEQAGIEMEDPFGVGPNNLPLDSICNNILDNLTAISARTFLLVDRVERGHQEGSQQTSETNITIKKH